jgi:acyl carrier protein
MSTVENVSIDQITGEIRGLIADILEVPAEEIGGEDSFRDDLDVDSLMALEIVAAVEKKYRIQIPEEELQSVKTLNDTVALARKYAGNSR